MYPDWGIVNDHRPQRERNRDHHPHAHYVALFVEERLKDLDYHGSGSHQHVCDAARGILGLHLLVGRTTKAEFVKAYGPQGPKMTWEQRAEAGVDAKHFQAALDANS
jgi:hypothetical protein